MIKRVALMESVSSNVRELLRRIGTNMSRPDKKNPCETASWASCRPASPFPARRDGVPVVGRGFDGMGGSCLKTGWTTGIVSSPGFAETAIYRRFSVIPAIWDRPKARRVLRYYARRWECEETIRSLEFQVNLAKTRTLLRVAGRWRGRLRNASTVPAGSPQRRPEGADYELRTAGFRTWKVNSSGIRSSVPGIREQKNERLFMGLRLTHKPLR